MKHHLPALLTAAVLALSACGSDATDTAEGGPQEYPSATVQTAFPGYTPAAGDAELPGLGAARPASGTVVWVKGPFDDRFATRDVRFEDGRVKGALTITSDVSGILDLEVQAGFFAADGSFLGVATWSLIAGEGHEHEHEGVPEESTEFVVAAPPAYADTATAASAGVVSLVNE